MRILEDRVSVHTHSRQLCEEWGGGEEEEETSVNYMYSMRGGWSPFACTAHTSFSSCSSFCPANTYSWSVKKEVGWWGEEEGEEEGEVKGSKGTGRERPVLVVL